MKSGVILYVSGEEPNGWQPEIDQTIGILKTEVECVEVITSKSGHHDIDYAWWTLLSRGMKHVVCKVARFEESGDISITGREMRLCG